MSTLLYFAFWAALFFVMMRFGCGAHVMGHGHGGHSGGHSDPPGGRTPPTRDIDPVCGMNVETNSAKSSLYRGRVYYFCSAEHRDAFEAAPERYLGEQARTLATEHRHA